MDADPTYHPALAGAVLAEPGGAWWNPVEKMLGAADFAGPDDGHGIQSRVFSAAYGRTVHLIRPDGHIGWRGAELDAPGLGGYLGRLFVGP